MSLTGEVADLSVREDVRARAARLGLLGWVRLEDGGGLYVHAEGEPAAIAELEAELRSLPGIDAVSDRHVRTEGHEQFAIRGIPAGVFVVQEHQATAHHFD